jgi:hypothetical protein
MTSVMMFQHHYGFCTLLALDAVFVEFEDL